MNKIARVYFRLWRPAGVVIVVALLSYILFFHNLAHFLPGYAAREVYTYQTAGSLHAIMNDPLNAPYKIVLYAVMQLGHHSLLATRIVAAAFAVAASLLFFMVARGWFGYRSALLGTIMFASSAGFLHIARLGSALILQMGLLLLLATAVWWRNEQRPSQPKLLLTLLAFAALWYVPGMIWFELLAVWVLHKQLRYAAWRLGWQQRTAGLVLFLVLVAPLIRAFVLSPHLLLTFAGLPQQFAPPLEMAQNIAGSLLSVGFHSNGLSSLWLAHLPLLNVTEIVLLALGVYTLVRRVALRRSLYILAATVLSLLLIGLNGPVDISSLLPLLYLVIAGGLYELLRRWMSVFPRNPFARFAGVFCIIAMLFFSVLYQYRVYFVAWPHNAVTRQTFTHQQA
jgi:hypothetical protein